MDAATPRIVSELEVRRMASGYPVARAGERIFRRIRVSGIEQSTIEASCWGLSGWSSVTGDDMMNMTSDELRAIAAVMDAAPR